MNYNKQKYEKFLKVEAKDSGFFKEELFHLKDDVQYPPKFLEELQRLQTDEICIENPVYRMDLEIHSNWLIGLRVYNEALDVFSNRIHVLKAVKRAAEYLANHDSFVDYYQKQIDLLESRDIDDLSVGGFESTVMLKDKAKEADNATIKSMDSFYSRGNTVD